MPTPQLGSINPNATLDELKDYLVGLNRYLNYLLSSLDTLNISRLDAKVIIANTITAVQIAANTITADKMNVTELSAISANLGHIVAGLIESIEIYGSYIATANGAYPRIELSSTGNLLTAFKDALNFLSITPDFSGVPSIKFDSPSGTSYLTKGLGALALISDIGLTLTAPADINISASSSGALRLQASASGGIWFNGSRGLAGTKTYYVSDTSGGSVNRKLTFKDGLLISET